MMDKRHSNADRLHRLASAEGRTATVLQVRARCLLVEYEGLRFKVASTPAERRDHWIGQRIELEVSDAFWDQKSQDESLRNLFSNRNLGSRGPAWSEAAEDPERWAWLEGKPHGTLIEGRVIRRMRRSILLDLGHGCEISTYPGHFMRTVCRRYRTGCLPAVGEPLALSFHGFHRDGSPKLYAWLHEQDPKYRRFDAGYRSRYLGEDGLFAVLPWERPDNDIEPNDYRSKKT
ncbi:MAG: hypothetical protein FJ189_01795 [Gammaproteobacteria bacterium]|nr:hypothetical protein [Gammaproteobacteria bacterium]